MKIQPARLWGVFLPVIYVFFSPVEYASGIDPLPPAKPGLEIGAALPAGYEPSGAAWHARYGKIMVVSDNGHISMLDREGGTLLDWRVPGDLEGICVADPGTDFVYLGVEQPDSIKEFDLSTGRVTRTFMLDHIMQGPDNSGLEALTFVPDPASPEGGYFYAGLQCTGEIYVLELPILTSDSATDVSLVGVFTPVPGRSDLSALDYDRENDILYAVWDAYNRVRAMRLDGEPLGEWMLPGNDQEGFAIGDCMVFVAEDVGKEVWRYPHFACGDASDPGGLNEYDCDSLNLPDTRRQPREHGRRSPNDLPDVVADTLQD